MKTALRQAVLITSIVGMNLACSDGTITRKSSTRNGISTFSKGSKVTVTGQSGIENVFESSLNGEDFVPLSLDVSIDGIRQKTGLQLTATNNKLLNFTVRVHGCHSLNEQSTDISPSIASTYGTEFGATNKTIRLIKGDTGCTTQLDDFIFQGSNDTSGKVYLADTRKKED